MSFSSTSEYLQNNYGVSMQIALDFILANLEAPQTIFDVSKEYCVTTAMLADIVSPAIPEVSTDLVLQYFTNNGIDASPLDQTPPIASATVHIAGTGQHTDSTLINTTYLVGLNGDYNFTVSGFGTGDRLVFPTDRLASIFNTDFSDGQVVVNYAFSGQLATITLVGLPDSVDSGIFGPTSFRNTFGSDSMN